MSAPFSQNVELVGPYQSCAPGAAGAMSYSFSCPNAGIYMIDWKISLPSLSQGGGQSGLIVTITNQTGPVTLYSSLPGASGGKMELLAALNDVIKFEMSSVTAGDLASLNTVKATIAISQGV